MRRSIVQALLALCVGWAQATASDPPINGINSMELSRPVRPWEFLSAVGPKAALLGNESGRFEAWVYPLKLCRDFHLRFRCGGQLFDGESLVRTVTVHPESTTLVYAWDTFRVEETLCVPPDAPGAIVSLKIETAQPLEVEVVFTRDFQLQWPAALGGPDLEWLPVSKAFCFSETTQRFSALIGSPSATVTQQEAFTNYGFCSECSFSLGTIGKGRATRTVVLAASWKGQAEAEKTYNRLSTDSDMLLRQASDWYLEQLRSSLCLELPDGDLQRAYDWSRVSMIQGMAENPFLGTGLLAGFRTSGNDYRPGFAWFFGRDTLWTSLALDAIGDFSSTRKALEFLCRYQRQDGKITHEVSQSASFVPWFKELQWAYAAADATPLLIIAMNDYVVKSGDAAFARAKWDNVWRAYRFLRSSWNAKCFPMNTNIGHGWVEGGPLYGAETELYQSGVGLEALRAMANLARVTGHKPLGEELDQAFEKGRIDLNQAFWMPELNRYAFGLDAHGKPIDAPSVLSTVPMWFGLLDGDKAGKMIRLLAAPEHQADWGMRIISSLDARYDPGGYHSGSVWPLFTGWASVGEYRYHQALPAYSNLRANALLALEGSPGHVTEVLSGDQYQTLSTGSPHQIWSAAMVVSPLVTGLLGLEANASGSLLFAPHIPIGWRNLGIRNAKVGQSLLDLKMEKDEHRILLDILPQGSGDCRIEFSPAFSPRARVIDVLVDGQAAPFHISTNSTDQHVAVSILVSGKSRRVEIRVASDFGLALDSRLPEVGGASRGIRLLEEAWSNDHDLLELEAAGPAGTVCDLGVWNPSSIRSVEGAVLLQGEADTRLRLQFPAGEAGSYSHRKVCIRFKPRD